MDRLRRPASRDEETGSVGKADGSAGGEVDPDAGLQESALGGSARPGGGAAAGAAPAVPAAAGTIAAAFPGMGAVAWPGGWAQPAGAGAGSLAGFPGSSVAAAARAPGPGASMLPGGADAAAGGGWPNWWSNVAALGPEDIVTSEDWGKKTANAIKGSTRLKERGLRNEDSMPITMFDEDLRNTGDDHWSASSGVAPYHGNLSRENSPIDTDEADNDDDSESDEVISTSGLGKRARLNNNIMGKKPKTSMDHWFQEQMGKIVEMNERLTACCESIARKEDKSGCSIKDVMALVKDCGAVPSTNEHFVATLVLTKRAEREMFMTLDTPEERFDWLKRKHEWMTKNDVAK
ncbi:unnamed protein product [Urochloa humidicola]